MQKCCVYSQDILNDMASVGIKFKVDGKWVSKTKVLEAVEASNDNLDPSLEKYIICNPQYETIPKEYIKNDSNDVEIKSISQSKSKSGFDILKAAVETQPKRKVRPVKCLENNTTYKNMSEAGRDLGFDPAAISDAVKRNRSYKGYTFQIIGD
jgi:hypothetical protein